MGLHDGGLELPNGPQILEGMVTEYADLTGVTLDLSYTHDNLPVALMTILTRRLMGALDLLQAVYDGTSPDAATGLQAEDAAWMVGVEPDAATYSAATVTLSGDAGTAVPSGSVIEGGGPNDDVRWTTTEDVTIGVGGTVDVVVACSEAGPVMADVGDLDKIVTAVPGWDSVTNAAAASPGQYREAGQALRQHVRAALAFTGAASSASIRAALLNLDWVQECVVIQNTYNVATVVSGKSMDPTSIWVFMVPDTLTSEQEEATAAIIHKKLAAGTKMMSSGGATEVLVEVTDAGGHTSRTVGWDYGAEVTTDITASVTLESGYTLADVTAGIEDAVAEYFEGLTLGAPLQEYGMILATEGVEGLAQVTFTASVGALPYSPSIDTSWVLGTVTVS